MKPLLALIVLFCLAGTLSAGELYQGVPVYGYGYSYQAVPMVYHAPVPVVYYAPPIMVQPYQKVAYWKQGLFGNTYRLKQKNVPVGPPLLYTPR